MAGKVALFANTQVATNRIIYTPSAFARESLPYLQETGTLQALQPHVSQRTNLPSYLFFSVLSGSGFLRYNGSTYPLQEGDCVFIDCRNGYAQSTSDHRNASGEYDALWHLSWVHFDGPTMASVYAKYQNRGGKPVFSPSSHRKARYTSVLDMLQTVASSDSYVRDMEIAAKLTELLTLLMEDAWAPSAAVPVDAKRLSVSEIHTYISEHYNEKLSLDSLSRQFFINKYYLTRLFREEYGYTVNGCISRVRIGRAKELLRFTDQPVDAVAEAVGYSDANYFARSFKKIEGVSPSEYRKLW